jgi:hypothetical protein
LAIIIGIIFYTYYLRYDLLTLTAAIIISSSLLYSMMFITQSNQEFVVAGVMDLSSMVLFFCLWTGYKLSRIEGCGFRNSTQI